MKKILFAAIGLSVTALFFFFLPFILGIFNQDIDPIDDQDLLYTPRKVIEKNNAYHDLIKIHENTDPKKDTTKNRILAHIKGEEWDEKFVEKMLAENKKNLEYLETATRKSEYQHPVYADLSTINFMDITEATLTQILPIARLNIIEAMLLSKQGQKQEALDKLFRMLALAETLQKAEGTLIQALIVITLEELTLEGIEGISQNSLLPKEVKVSYAKQLEKYKGTHFEEAFKGEYLLFTTVLNEIGGENKGLGEFTPAWFEKMTQLAPQFYFQPNRTRQLAAENKRRGIALLNTPCAEQQENSNELEEVEVAPKSVISLYFKKNAAGKILYDALAIRPKGAKEKKCKIEKLFTEVQQDFK